MSDRLGTVRVGVVQAASKFLDREGSTARAIELIEEAGSLGAELIVFPEGFIPGHPSWYHFHAGSSAAGRQMGGELFRNSIVVGGAETDQIGNAAQRAKARVIIGVCEKRGATKGTMWNSSIHFDERGQIASIRRKLTPTVGERLVHVGGSSEGLKLTETRFGRVSNLICAENFNPLMIFSLIAQQSLVHTAQWPAHFAREANVMREIIGIASRALAYQSGSYVLSSAGLLDEEGVERTGRSEEDRAWLRQPGNQGGSCIVAPSGKVIAEADDEETILLAELELDRVIDKSLIQDYAGHYNRADIFKLSIIQGNDTIFEAPWNDPDMSAVRDTEVCTSKGPEADDVGATQSVVNRD